jgi:aspartate 1-decarboxylase
MEKRTNKIHDNESRLSLNSYQLNQSYTCMQFHFSHGPSACIFAPMLIEVLKSKIHRVTVTEANLNYIGSITLDPLLMEAADMIEGEKVQVLNCMNGERLETYIIQGERGSGVVCLNGPAARKVTPGDVVIVVTYAHMTREEALVFKPAIVFPDTATNKLA